MEFEDHLILHHDINALTVQWVATGDLERMHLLLHERYPCDHPVYALTDDEVLA